MVYWELIKKSYILQLQYRMAHFINNLGSLIFGFVYIAIWTGILTGKEQPDLYNVTDMTNYMAFTQCLLWITGFMTPGLKIQDSVRTGAISIEMARPASFFLISISQEVGKIAYNFLFRSLPIGLVFVVTVGFYVPANGITFFWSLASILLGIFVSLNMNYLLGISACWTTEISWAHLTYITLLFGLGGQMVPVDLLPGSLSQIPLYLPFACSIYYPVMIYLEQVPNTPVEPLIIQLAWGFILAGLSICMTRQARKRLEIQGG
ncbi:ABC transporter permease [Paenactinomyces guangxiensis]|uniref:ABC transporter permease n=1 Tax=Paenactinomyces guangxiensis TaxID=1490290 RepID=A0A7W1WSM4_9BACL|nr:ABC transporter permease [Paenactinomyces guangxiensis]MBA4495323.1 ABC transporter permease [Paenactinomyces guangxiensis]MBH8592555.1 ABC transporter permease [Paenactinomyces guangxiensis]